VGVPAVRTGEIRASGVGRVFELRVVKAQSLKETILKRQRPPRRELWALRDVDLHVEPGETFGVVGQNGSGKSTLLKLLAGVFAASEGRIAVGGRVGSLIELGAGFHPEFTGAENVYLSAAIHGIPRSYVDEHLDEILSFAELEDFADVAVKTYSSGMFMRLGFSVAMSVHPDLLLLDEVLAVGDEAFQQKCYGRIWDYKRGGGTIVFVSHDPAVVERLCDRAILLEQGRIVEEGSARDVLRAYHRRLTQRRGVPAAPLAVQPGAKCQVQEVRAAGGDGAVRERFVDGEPFLIETWLYSPTGLSGAQLTVTLRETSGREIGAQTAMGLDLPPDRLTPVRLHLDNPPLRDGRFAVDVVVVSHDGDEELASAERALELAFFSEDAQGSGPIGLRGKWELPRHAADAVAEAVER
jgi:ABC-type polysaccharide/polyol phosphate transport system ATPase subunit